MQSLELGREEIVLRAEQLKVTGPGIPPSKEKGEIWEGPHFSLAKKGTDEVSMLRLSVMGDDPTTREHVINVFCKALGSDAKVFKLSSAPHNETVLWSSWNTE